MRPRPKLVTVAKPALRLVTEADAPYPTPTLRAKWVAAIGWLRRGSGPGWILDRGSVPKFRAHTTE